MGRLEEFFDYVNDKIIRCELTIQEGEDLIDAYAKRLEEE